MQAILHCDRNWGIGKRNDLMFHLPKDMKFFRTTTTNKVVVMGSNTLLSFPGGKPLKGRTNIVLWPGGDENRAREDGFVMVQSLPELFREIAKYPPQDVYVSLLESVKGAEVTFHRLKCGNHRRLVRERIAHVQVHRMRVPAVPRKRRA